MDNWLNWSGDSPEIVEAKVKEMQERDVRVGELLRELHYLASSKPHPWWDSQRTTEAEFWASYAFMHPGYKVEELESALRTKTGESSTHAPVKPGNRLTPSELESLRQETRQAKAQIRQLLGRN